MATNGSKKKDDSPNKKASVKEKKDNTAQESTATKSVRGRSKRDTLTPRQQEVLKLLVDGMTNKQIADELKTSVKTIDAHRASIMTRLQTYSLAGLVKYAIRNGLSSID